MNQRRSNLTLKKKDIFTSSVCILFIICFLALNPVNADLNTKQLCKSGDIFEKRLLAGNNRNDICTQYKGQVMLIVNTASQCAYTNQYEGLEELYALYKSQGLVVLGFPSNDFGGQEPGTENKIKDFCVNTYAVKFPMYEKTRVSGNNIDPLYQSLFNASGEKPRWNFHKYLVDRAGKVVASFSSSTKPFDRKLVSKIENLL